MNVSNDYVVIPLCIRTISNNDISSLSPLYVEKKKWMKIRRDGIEFEISVSTKSNNQTYNYNGEL